jgi:lipopolysaccharide biosynthesis glycosyltransferase
VIDVYIGYDPREAVAYHVCQNSIIENCSTPEDLAFHPVRGERRDGSNDFIYARFLVPYLQSYRGFALFVDGDMIVRDDICKLWELRDDTKAVQVVQHHYKTKFPVKYLGNKNEDYPRKNWSSVILWNCSHYGNRWIEPDTIKKATGEHLHRFEWLSGDRIGHLPDEWNRLVLEQEVTPSDKLLHYTIGTPCFPEYSDCDHSAEWWKQFDKTISPVSWGQR